MRGVGHVLKIVLRLACYAGLAFVVAGFGALVLLSLLGLCPTLNEGNIRCISPGATSLAEFGMTVMLLTVFTGFPALLAMGGLVYLVLDTGKLIKRWRGPATVPGQSGPSLTNAENLPHKDIPDPGAAPIPPRAERAPDGPGRKFLKVLLILFGLFLAAGVVAGIIEGITS